MKNILLLLLCITAFASFAGCAARAEPITGLPTPFTEYADIDEARKAFDANFLEPAALPSGFEKQGYSVWNDGSMAEIHYSCGDTSAKYRVSATLTPAEMNGDYNHYDNERTLTVGELSVACAGNGDTVSTAMWEADGFAYCLLSGAPLSADELQAFILSIA